MVKNHHTPGPWSFYTTPQPNGCPIVGDPGGLMIAQLSHSVDHYDQKEEAIANARLIAAAPELLGALQKMVKMASTGMVDFNPHDEFVMSLARAAIAKATGVEP